ncbi:hypothetical protein THOM_2373 [Trachipleistophora hominis]|uniref:Uncharacterized protein n=1 Tax=Trachipleistophora hominis TaxID=72359 RepID=L7JUJ5_TRAHO|nr:hypothetical protein THOM_2373 [Trachipleistophora hominis]
MEKKIIVKSHVSFIKDNKKIYTLDTSLIDPHTNAPYSSLLSDGSTLALGTTKSGKMVVLPSNYMEERTLKDEIDYKYSTNSSDHDITAIMCFGMVNGNMVFIDDEYEDAIEVSIKNTDENEHKTHFLI